MFRDHKYCNTECCFNTRELSEGKEYNNKNNELRFKENNK